jgi:ribonuclease D
LIREHGEEVMELLVSLRARADKGELPAPEDMQGQRDPNRRKREDALREFRTHKALLRKVTASVVLPNPLLEALAKTPPRSVGEVLAVPYLGEKRVRLYGDELVTLLGRLLP